MTMMQTGDQADADGVLANLDVETEITRVDAAAIAVLNRSEIEAQIDAAHKYPRTIDRFLKEAIGMATISMAVAKSCIYALPRGKNEDGSQKLISGPSVRLAEIAASAYGNIHAGTRVVDTDETTVTAQGVCLDIQKNVRITVETKRRITDRRGRRFNEDMVVVTGNAAASIALRNAIFRVIPRAYIDFIYARAKAVAVGTAQTLNIRRNEVFADFEKLGVSKERVLEKVGKAGLADVGLDELELLIGIANAIQSNELSIDAAFPVAAPAPPAPAAPADDGKRISMRGQKVAETKAEPAMTPEPEVKSESTGVVQTELKTTPVSEPKTDASDGGKKR